MSDEKSYAERYAEAWACFDEAFRLPLDMNDPLTRAIMAQCAAKWDAERPDTPRD